MRRAVDGGGHVGGRGALADPAPDGRILLREEAGPLGLGLFGNQGQRGIRTGHDRGHRGLIGQQSALACGERRLGRSKRGERLVDLLERRRRRLGLRGRVVRRRPALVQLGQMIDPLLQTRCQMRQPQQPGIRARSPALPALLLRAQARQAGPARAEGFERGRARLRSAGSPRAASSARLRPRSPRPRGSRASEPGSRLPPTAGQSPPAQWPRAPPAPRRPARGPRRSFRADAYRPPRPGRSAASRPRGPGRRPRPGQSGGRGRAQFGACSRVTNRHIRLAICMRLRWMLNGLGIAAQEPIREPSRRRGQSRFAPRTAQNCSQSPPLLGSALKGPSGVWPQS